MDSSNDPAGGEMSTLSSALGPGFERAVISAVIHVREVCTLALPLLTPKYFEDEAHSLIVEHAQRLQEKSGKFPSAVMIIATLRESAVNAKAAVKQSLERAVDICESDNSLSSADVDFVRAKLGEFIQRSATRAALLQAVELHEKGKDDEAVTLMIKSRDRISSLLSSAGSMGISLFDTKDKINGYIRRNKSSKNCPYGVPKLDKIMRGGLECGCLGMFMGPPGRGKTRALIQAGANALGYGRVVVHVTLELAKEDISMRYDARLTGTPINDIKARPKHHAARIHHETEALRFLGSELFIQQWAPGEATILDVTSYIHRIQDTLGKPVDVLLLDYVDLLKPTRGDERWEQHGQMAVGAKRLAVIENLCLWSASQTKTDSFSRRNIQLSDVSDTVEKVRISDVVLGLCQTESEKRSNKLRMIILKNRLGGNEGKVIDCLVRDETQSIQEDVIHTDARDASEDDF